MDERLLCLNYDIVLGPYLGAPAEHKLAFLHWLIEGIRMMRMQLEGRPR